MSATRTPSWCRTPHARCSSATDRPSASGEPAALASPPALTPDHRFADAPLDRRIVLGDQKQAQRQHPEAEDRQEPEAPAHDQEETQRYPVPAATGLAHPPHEPAKPRGQLGFNL